MSEPKSYLAQIFLVPDSSWPPNKTFLLTLDVELRRLWGLDTTRQPSQLNDSDLQTPLQDLEQVIIAWTKICQESSEAQHGQGQKATAFLKRSCARLLRWINVGSSGDSESISDIHTDLEVAERAYQEAQDTIGILWTSFVADMVYTICGDCINPKERGKILAKRMVDYGASPFDDVAAFVCLRLARKLSLGEPHLQASGNFDRVSRLFHYGVGLCKAIPNQAVLAQVHATYGHVLVGINQHAKALVQL